MPQDRFQGHDYYLMDELLTEEHRLIRDSVREWVKRDVSPIIEEYAQKVWRELVLLDPIFQLNTVEVVLTRFPMD